jgi:hypothetical protein
VKKRSHVIQSQTKPIEYAKRLIVKSAVTSTAGGNAESKEE